MKTFALLPLLALGFLNAPAFGAEAGDALKITVRPNSQFVSLQKVNIFASRLMVETVSGEDLRIHCSGMPGIGLVQLHPSRNSLFPARTLKIEHRHFGKLCSKHLGEISSRLGKGKEPMTIEYGRDSGGRSVLKDIRPATAEEIAAAEAEKAARAQVAASKQRKATKAPASSISPRIADPLIPKSDGPLLQIPRPEEVSDSLASEANAAEASEAPRRSLEREIQDIPGATPPFISDADEEAFSSLP